MSKAILKTFIKLRALMLACLFPAFCAGCACEGSFLCDSCLSALRENLARKRSCEKFDHYDCALDGLIAAGPYEDHQLLAKLIHLFKYEFVKELAVPLGILLADAMRGIDDRRFLICPVPLHKKRLRWRGFNQAELLAARLAGLTGMEIIVPLKRVTYSKPQMELGREERARNVEGAFVIDDSHKSFNICKHGVPILLVDDVATTLSTLQACAKILKDNGAPTVYGLVLARAA